MDQIQILNVFTSQSLKKVLYDQNINNNFDKLYDIIIQKIIDKKKIYLLKIN